MSVEAGNRVQTGTAKEIKPFRVVQHSHLLYWWVLWAYGFICAGLTYFQGVPVRVLEDKALLFHPSPWLALSFLCVFLFVLTFTTVQARGIYSYVLIMVIAGIVYGVPRIPGFEHLASRFPDLRVHLNLAFYLTFSTALLALWLIVLFVDRFSWLQFRPGQVTEEHLFGQRGENTFPTAGTVVKHLPDDFFRHKVLGLWFFGLGTGDIIVTPQGRDSFELRNVVHATRKFGDMQNMINLVIVAGH